MVDRHNAGSAIGAELLAVSGQMLGWWKRVRDGILTKARLRGECMPSEIFACDSAMLTRGSVCGCAKTAGTCRELLRREVSLFLFAFVSGVEPTNNAAERALRHGVLWRKMSHGPKSPGGFRIPGVHLVGGGEHAACKVGAYGISLTACMTAAAKSVSCRRCCPCQIRLMPPDLQTASERLPREIVMPFSTKYAFCHLTLQSVPDHRLGHSVECPALSQLLHAGAPNLSPKQRRRRDRSLAGQESLQPRPLPHRDRVK